MAGTQLNKSVYYLIPSPSKPSSGGTLLFHLRRGYLWLREGEGLAWHHRAWAWEEVSRPLCLGQVSKSGIHGERFWQRI